jgi:membrane dipeptidase
VSDKTFYDVLEVTTKPVIASHSSCFVYSDIPRNMKDDMFRALAKNGGVVGVNFGSSFLSQKDADELKKMITQHNAIEPNLLGEELDAFAAKDHAESGEVHAKVGNATVEDAAECIDHIVKVAGIDHVGIGSDFDGISNVPQGLEDVSKMPNLTAALLKRAYKEDDIKKIMGGNYLRVVREVVGN